MKVRDYPKLGESDIIINTTYVSKIENKHHLSPVLMKLSNVHTYSYLKTSLIHYHLVVKIIDAVFH